MVKNLTLLIDNISVKGFYFPAKVKTDNELVYLGDAKFKTKTLSYMVSGLNFVYVFFLYVNKNEKNVYDILHKAEIKLVEKLGLNVKSYSIFKPGLIIDWKDGEILKFISFLNSQKPDFKIFIDEKTYKVTPQYSSFGVLFQSTLTSISCMFCDFLSCEYRRSALDEKLIKKILSS